MTILFGLELEAFSSSNKDEPFNYSLPPDFCHLTGRVDGCPLLIEVRSAPSSSLEQCVGEINRELMILRNNGVLLNEGCYEYKFSAKKIQEARRSTTARWGKEPLNVRNLYGKSPRLLPSGTVLASLQINVSNQLRPAWTDSNGKLHPAQFGLLDTAQAVRDLDEIFFKDEAIVNSKRQKGMYAIKDGVRLEYRSLPNYAFHSLMMVGNGIMNKIYQASKEWAS